MSRNQRVIEAIFSVVDEVNQLLPMEQRLEKSTDTALSGGSGTLDSLGLVNLIVTTEQRIEEEFGVSITLAEEMVISKEISPFESIGSLADYITKCLNGVDGGEKNI